jgi:hypothetical protein
MLRGDTLTGQTTGVFLTVGRQPVTSRRLHQHQLISDLFKS